MTDSIQITHSPADGTVVSGDPRPHHGILKDAGFRWSRSIPGWYVPRSRDRAPDVAKIERVAEALRSAGLDVAVAIDAAPRPAAEREAAAAERSDARAAALASKSDRLAGEADRRLAAARARADLIPMGQPILVGHHSEGRHRRDLARINRDYDAGLAADAAAREAERRSLAASSRQAHRESGPATVRRIEKLEADLRGLDRRLARCPASGRTLNNLIEAPAASCPICYCTVAVSDRVVAEHTSAGGLAQEAALLTRKAAVEDDLTYWRAHLAALEADGFRLLGPADFKPGDRVNGTATVVRVNKKSLTVQYDVFPAGMTNKLAYDKVTSHEAVAS